MLFTRIASAILVSFLLSLALGELASKVLLLILPESLTQIAWVINGALVAFLCLCLGQIGLVIAYGEKQQEEWIKNYELVSHVISGAIVFSSINGIAFSINTPSTKQFAFCVAMAGMIFFLYGINLLKKFRSKKESGIQENRETPSNEIESYKEKIKKSLLIQTLALTQVKLGANIGWQERQVLTLNLVWLETFMFIAENVDKSLEEKAQYFHAIDEDSLKIPNKLNIKSFSDCKFSQEVAFKYAEFLNQPNAFTECDYKPESILPFPKTEIIRICKHYAECLSKDVFVSRAILMADKQRAEQVSFAILEAETILRNDTSFIPVDDTLLPVDADKNSAFGRAYMMNR